MPRNTLSKIDASHGYRVHDDGLQKGKIPTQLTAGGDRADHLINPALAGFFGQQWILLCRILVLLTGSN